MDVRREMGIVGPADNTVGKFMAMKYGSAACDSPYDVESALPAGFDVDGIFDFLKPAEGNGGRTPAIEPKHRDPIAPLRADEQLFINSHVIRAGIGACVEEVPLIHNLASFPSGKHTVMALAIRLKEGEKNLGNNKPKPAHSA